MANPLTQLIQFGQSFWYDNIRRALLTGGELQRMVAEDGLRGLTSNPTIFEKAIAGSADYDDSLRRHLDLAPRELFLELETEDIGAAADVLRPVYDSSRARDGYVSIEVTPDLAADAGATIEQARMLWRRLARPNVMVKVPSTPECLPAIHTLLAEGININITLLFGFAPYQQVIEAWLSALEARLARGLDIDRVASVASLFVSRVDTKIDARLEEMARAQPARAEEFRRLEGQAGIANARRMYQLFRQTVTGERFKKLAAHGAMPQRLLWASTSTKNPQYPDTLYADALIGPDTVDTMPDVTIHAFRDHGHPADRLSGTLAAAQPVLGGLRAAGIDFEQALQELQEEGVEKFAASYRELLEAIRGKVSSLRSGAAGAMTLAYPDAQQGGEERGKAALAALESHHFAAAIWRKDASPWTADANVAAKIRNRLGWLDLPETMIEHTPEVASFAQSCQAAGLRQAVLLGMGGSSLAPEVFRRVFGAAPSSLALTVLDTTDPAAIAAVDRRLNYAQTLFIVSSKSGGTLEPNCLFAYFWKRAGETLGQAQAGSHFIAITDEGTSLERLAREHGFRRVWINPADIGGRYSALSYFGLVPAALLGVDIDQLLRRAQIMAQACAAAVPLEGNPGARLGAALGAWALAGRDKLTFIASPGLAACGTWLEQLIAESTGKQGKGIVPIDAEPPGEPTVYGADRVFVRLQLAGDPEATGGDWAERQLAAGAPVVTIALRDRYDLAQEFFRWEFATAAAGCVLGINPFDEPNVQESKDNTDRVIERFVAGGRSAAGLDAAPIARQDGLAAYAPAPAADAGGVEGELARLLFALRPGDYLALMAYTAPTPEVDRALLQLRLLFRNRLRVATTLGYGPRFLHSTGQLHKGGANRGVFLQLTGAEADDIAIPGKPFSFGTLIAAQAAGDVQSLVAHERRLLRIDWGAAPAAQAVRRLAALAETVLTGAEMKA